MKGKVVVKLLLGIIVLAVVIWILTKVLVEPRVEKKIQTELNKTSRDYVIEIDRVHISLIKRGLTLERITFSSRKKQADGKDLKGKIAAIKCRGISLLKVLFKKDIDIHDITITQCSVMGKIPVSEKTKLPVISPLNIRIDRVVFDEIDLAIEYPESRQFFSMKKGDLKFYNVHLEKQDTLSPRIFRQLDFEAEELLSASADSFYTYKFNGIDYSANTNTLAVDSLSIQPNYKNYDFTARHKYQTDRFEVVFSRVYVYDFPAGTFIESGSLISSYIEIGEFNANVFRDKRKEFLHVIRPTFQELIVNYPAAISIDSIFVKSGNASYTEHAEEANEPGIISFNEINVKLYKITNDTVYKTNNGFLELKGKALLMKKGKLTMALKAKLFDHNNTFSVNGTLSNLEAKELNPMLEKNAYVYATSGKVDAMNFSFMANNDRATGKMTMLYHELFLAFKNKDTDDTIAFKERFISQIANHKIMDSNPVPGKDVREGIIEYERDPEKFLFNYCFKSIFSGIKSSLVKPPKRKKDDK